MSKKLGAVQSQNSLVLRCACKAFSEPSAYNQVLFHKTCRLDFFCYASFFCIYCDFANFLRSGGKLGLFCFTKLTVWLFFLLRQFFLHLVEIAMIVGYIFAVHSYLILYHNLFVLLYNKKCSLKIELLLSNFMGALHFRRRPFLSLCG